MSESNVLLGIDWRPSSRRAYVLNSAGELLRRHEDEIGTAQAGGDFEGELQDLLQLLQLKQADVVMSGAVGGRGGWRETPHLPTSHALTELPATLLELRTRLPGLRCRIVPGYESVDVHGLPDVLRGEETLVLGAMRLIGPNGWFLLPGMHSKWVKVDQGRIVEFFTFVTGELYALLTRHGSLAELAREDDAAPEAFAAGLQAGRYGRLSHTAFCCEALVVTGSMPAGHAASYLSGLTIGIELYDMLRRAPEGMPLPSSRSMCCAISISSSHVWGGPPYPASCSSFLL